jgi:filamentous hemagglutinin family protein
MNRNHHRIVFNAARGQLMAVSECARSLGKASACTVTTAAASLLFCLPLQAQISADPNAPGNQRPTVLNAANGVPLVNITTPSAAGVSRNIYQQFDIGSQGAILNEVNSSQPSQLNGWVEVGGQRAEVVIANPAGINVNGGGFINASRATLTTGTPVMNAGALDGFRVQGGQVRIEGLGLDASTTDHAAILARAVAVNAGLWANALTVVTGANDVSTDGARVTEAAPSGAAPAFALDVAALGGMYAGQIRLVGTEAGLGVNQGGLIDARGALTLEVNGWLSQSAGSRTHGDAVNISVQGVRNQDGAVIAARDVLSIVAGEVHNTEGALLLSAGDMALSASERIENRSAGIEALGNLSISTPVLINANDHFETQLVQVDGPLALSLIQPSGSATQIPLGSLVWQEWERAGQYAYDTSPDPHAGLDPQLGTTPIPELGQVSCSDPQDDATCVRVPGADYPINDPAWAYFGLLAPSPQPASPVPLAPAPTAPVLPPGATPAQQVAHEQALLTYQAALAQHQTEQANRTAWETWNTETEARYTALDARIETYNQGFAGAVIRNWTRFDIQRTVSQTQVVSSAPGRITAGGDLSLYGQDLLNDNSEIVAGGALRGDLHRLVNQTTPGEHVVQDSGTAHSSWVYSRRSGALRTGTKRWRRDTSAPAPYAPPAAVTSVDLQVTQLDHNVVGLPPAPLALPGSALFAAAADPTISRLFETDTRFTDYRQWLSSDHMLSALSTDPNNVHKRLGDGFIEQRLIREQVGALTGQRFLGDFTNDEAQYLALMNAGVTFAQAHQLRPGITLSAEQVTALTSDIVWLETQPITLPDGRTTQALVPRVYLLPRAGDLAPTGALIAGREVQLQLDGSLHNSGTIAGRSIVRIDAQDIHHSGRIVSQGTTALNAERDIVIAGGQVSASDALVLSAGQDITVTSTTRSSQHTGEPAAVEGGNSLAHLLRKPREPEPGSQTERTTLDRVASLHVMGDAGVLLAQAGRDITLQAPVIDNAGTGTTALLAARDLDLNTVTTGRQDDIRWDAHNRLRVDQRKETGTRITANGDVVLRAGQDITARAAAVQAGDQLSTVAGRNLIVEAGETTVELDEAHRTKSSGPISSKTTTTKITHRSTQAQVSELQGQSVELLGTNVVSVGTHIQGQDSVHIEGTDQTLLYAAQDRSFTQVDVTTKRSSVVGPKYRKTESTDIEFSSVGIGTELISDQAVRIGVGEHTELVGARVSAPRIEFVRSEQAAPNASGELLLGAVVEKDVHSHQSKTVTDGVWQKVISSGHETETLNSTELHGQVQFDPSLSISAQIPAGPLRQQIGQLVQQPGLEYLQALAKRDDIDWQAIELAQRQWNDKQQGLTGAGAAILVLVVALFTAGMGTAAVGTTSAVGTTTVGGATLATTTAAGATVYTAAGAALNAAFTSLASTAAVSFVNNGGDLGAVFKDLGSSASVNQLITGMFTAGIATSLASQITVDGKALGSITAKDGFTSYFSKSLIEQSTSAVVNSAINGTSLKDGLQNALINSALGSATALGANAIGDLGLLQDLNGEPVLNPAGKALLHALLGCAGGAAQAGSQGCAAGASGAVLGELAAAWYDPNGTKPRPETEAFAAAVAGLGGVLAGDESGVGVNIAAQAGRNAAANNYLNHVERGELQRAQRDCLSGQTSACQTATTLRLKDELSDRLLADSVARCVGDACREVASFAYEEMRRVGCPMPSACPDQSALQQFWQVAQAKAQGLKPIYPEEWLFDIKAATDLARAGLRTLSGSGADASLQALKRLRTAPDSPPDMPGFSSLAVRDFSPGSTHRAEVINAGQVTDRDLLPRIDELNRANNSQIESMIGRAPEWWSTQRPAWKEGTLVTDRVTTQTETYRMVVDEQKFKEIDRLITTGDHEAAVKQLGAWATRDPIATVADVRGNLAISSEWKGTNGTSMYVVEFSMKPGVGLREGQVGPMFDRLTSSVLRGGGHQVQFMNASPQTSPASFIIDLNNSRKLAP